MTHSHRFCPQLLHWTVNEPVEVTMPLDPGIDGLITDFPDRLRWILGARGESR